MSAGTKLPGTPEPMYMWAGAGGVDDTPLALGLVGDLEDVVARDRHLDATTNVPFS